MMLPLDGIDATDAEAGGEDDQEVPVAGPAATEHRLLVEPGHAGERIDALIAALVPALSRAAAQRLIVDARVRINDIVVGKPGQRVHAGDAIAVFVPAPVPIELAAEDLPLCILYEDADLIVIDKPAGLVVHPAAGHPRGTLVNALLFHCNDLSGIGGALRPGIVHRLDKDTSGVMVATKNDRAHAVLGAAFAAKSRGEPGGIVREYLGITAPPPPGATGTLRTWHARHPSDRKRFSSKVASGKPAVTHWTVVEPLPGAALVRFRLETGRTHQIRVHAADHSFPLLGDPLYGKTPRPLAAVAAQLGRQALHATLLELDHPTTAARLRFESPLPHDLVEVLSELRSRRSPDL
ncbi:MAG TPA: RluA family pseudouridine synthase [Kofleriaceae bacterium]|jgi:23S rRNA pseudouridine1911/1915/1917 synthase|nr:RluA family pseudouridine synthase [Kofleriaceae bacterium]